VGITQLKGLERQIMVPIDETPTVNRFYSKLISIDIAPKEEKFEVKHKHKEKHVHEKKIHGRSKARDLMEVFGVFPTILEQRHERLSYFKIEFEGLTEEDLKDIQKRVNAIAGEVFEDDELKEHLEMLRYHTCNYIEEEIEKSYEKTKGIKEKLLKCWKELPEEKKKEFTLDPNKISDSHEPWTKLSDQHFKHLIKEFDKHIAEGTIIPKKEHPDGKSFISHVIKNNP